MRSRARSGQSAFSESSPADAKDAKIERSATASTLCPMEGDPSPDGRSRLGSTDYSDAGDSLYGFSPPATGDTSSTNRPGGRARMGSFMPETIDEQENEQDADEEEQEAEPNSEVSRVPQATPGSAKHDIRDCRPCAWFHKPRGCQNGADCRHCHLCPDGELKARKKGKVQALRGAKTEPQYISQPKVEQTVPQVQRDTSSTEPQKIELPQPDSTTTLGSDTPDMPSPPPGLSQPREPLASKGSVSHGTGECRPCAWFYKPGGCQNAAECRHCHLCPEGEIKNRRKAKASLLRAQRDGQAENDSDEDSDSSSQQQGKSDGEVVAKVSLPFPSRRNKSLPEGPFPSPGSELHGTGECRPCAWFHKTQGCSNGDQCRHCHLCEEGEIRDRRKVKVSSLKRQNMNGQRAVEQALWMVQKQQEILFTAQWQAQTLWAAVWESQQAATLMQAGIGGMEVGSTADGSPAAETESLTDASPKALGTPITLSVSTK